MIKLKSAHDGMVVYVPDAPPRGCHLDIRKKIGLFPLLYVMLKGNIHNYYKQISESRIGLVTFFTSLTPNIVVSLIQRNTQRKNLPRL